MDAQECTCSRGSTIMPVTVQSWQLNNACYCTGITVLSFLHWHYCTANCCTCIRYYQYCSGTTVLSLLHLHYCTATTVLTSLYNTITAFALLYCLATLALLYCHYCTGITVLSYCTGITGTVTGTWHHYYRY